MFFPKGQGTELRKTTGAKTVNFKNMCHFKNIFYFCLISIILMLKYPWMQECIAHSLPKETNNKKCLFLCKNKNHKYSNSFLPQQKY